MRLSKEAARYYEYEMEDTKQFTITKITKALLFKNNAIYEVCDDFDDYNSSKK